MSIIDNLLVLLDDGNRISIEEIQILLPKFSKQIISASLGRIISKKLACKDKQNYYKITERGENLNTEILSNIQRTKNRTDYTECYFVLFNIPEKERINRDIMRSYLNSNGFGRLHNTVWIGLNTDINSLRNLIKSLKIENKVLFFKANLNKKDINNIIKETDWNIKSIITQYKKFKINVDEFLLNKNKQAMRARFLVYEYAKICKQDPILPTTNLPNEYIALDLDKAYEALRKYCN